MANNVDHPKHYNSHPAGIECIDVVEHLSFNIGNAIKYLWRCDLKNGNEDLEKAIWYIRRELERRRKLAVSKAADDAEVAKMEHTNGPWTISFDPERSPHIWIEAKTNVGVCKIETCSYDDGLGHRLTKEDWANARLIAAAPELLGALRAIVTAAELHGANSVVFFEARNQALELIAKAEGR